MTIKLTQAYILRWVT